MHARARRTANGGLTLVEVVIVVVLFSLVFIALPVLIGPRSEGKRIRCRNNLNQLAKGMATYINEHGDNRWYPFPSGRGLATRTFTGSEWLASLYWTGVIPDPGVFLCPEARDSNDDGVDLGTHHAVAGKFGPRTVSYAGIHCYSLTDAHGFAVPGPIPADHPPKTPMASDDTQGDINHGTLKNGGMAILFFDFHVEFRTNMELDLEHAVGEEGGLLERLQN